MICWPDPLGLVVFWATLLYTNASTYETTTSSFCAALVLVVVMPSDSAESVLGFVLQLPVIQQVENI